MVVEQGDNDDGTQIVDDRQCQQKHLEAERYPLAEQGHDAKGKGNIGRGRNSPAAQAGDFTGVKQQEPQGRKQHATKGGQGRKHGFFPTGEGAGHQLAFHFQANHQKENRHHAVIDPMSQRLVQIQAADPQLNTGAKQLLINIYQTGVGHHHGDDRRHYQ